MTETSRRVWIVGCPGAELLDITGPWEVMCHANDVLERRAYELQLVVPLGGAVDTRHGLTIGPARSPRGRASATRARCGARARGSSGSAPPSTAGASPTSDTRAFDRHFPGRAARRSPMTPPRVTSGEAAKVSRRSRLFSEGADGMTDTIRSPGGLYRLNGPSGL